MLSPFADTLNLHWYFEVRPPTDLNERQHWETTKRYFRAKIIMMMDMVYYSLIDHVLGAKGKFNQFKEEVSKRENVPRCMRSMLTDEILIGHVSILNDQWHTFHRGVEAENRRLCELS
jgi:hypothetical protein